MKTMITQMKCERVPVRDGNQLRMITPVQESEEILERNKPIEIGSYYVQPLIERPGNERIGGGSLYGPYKTIEKAREIAMNESVNIMAAMGEWCDDGYVIIEIKEIQRTISSGPELSIVRETA